VNCYVCGEEVVQGGSDRGKAMHVHHTVYPSLLNAGVEQTVVLCGGCHHRLHGACGRRPTCTQLNRFAELVGLCGGNRSLAASWLRDERAGYV
jgi:hypothetical protein